MGIHKAWCSWEEGGSCTCGCLEAEASLAALDSAPRHSKAPTETQRLKAELAALRKRLAEYELRQWPPPDEQEADILVWSAETGFDVAFRHAEVWWSQNPDGESLTPTHWMPLPAVPGDSDGIRD